MRLLYTAKDGRLGRTDDLIGDQIPPYAILSHTWAGQEVTYKDLQNHKDIEDVDARFKGGYRKIFFCAAQAKRDGIDHFWVDTCCIDKANNTELSEAINSMFRWYQSAKKCYVYLSDVENDTLDGDGGSSRRWKTAFRQSRWFTRGWTLQELLAPAMVTFYSREGELLGSKQSLKDTINEITGIPSDALSGKQIIEFSVAERFSWAQKRQTTRDEDSAYCLFGIFGCHLPLIYGEGKEKALNRLKREIKAASEDIRGTPPSSPNQAPNKRTKTGISSSPQSSSAMQRTVPTYPQEASQISRTSLNDVQRQDLLSSLRFDQIDARQMTIKSAHAKTCRWLLKCKEYLSWLDATKLEEHHGFLWIKGKAGTGKSTLMKYVLVNARKTMKDHIMLSFFFNARGEEIEKSTTGTYRSLLLQLLERLPALRSVFDSLGLSTSKLAADHQWNIETLKMLLEQAIQSSGNSSIVCFIDALDECEEDQVRDMIQFFERIGDLAVSNGIRFQVCFSSRHYPHVTIRHGLELVLEGQEGHSQDISNYIETELKIGKSKSAQRIRVELQEKASGIFMWVVLVVGILNKEFDDGQVHALRQKLKTIPKDLHELFRDILTRDAHNKDRLVLCIQWVLFAKQPLSPEQLYHALLLSIDSDAVSEWDPEETTKDDIERFLLNSSKGLAEATVSKEPRVQFIHESVRDFLLKENGLGKIWPEYENNFHGKSHERLKQCCLDYISIDVTTPLQIPDRLPKASLQKAAALRTSAIQMFPFLEYAVHNVLYHADAAEEGGILQADFLDSFLLPRWVKLDNVFEKHEVRRHTERVSLLYLLAELDMAHLIRVLGSASRCMDVEAERYGCPLFAAAAMSSEKALEACLESIEVRQADSNPVAAVGEQQFMRKSAQRTARRDFVYSKAKHYLANAVELQHDGMLAFLIRSGRFRLDSKDSRGRTALWWACKNGYETSARLLLTADPAVADSKDNDAKTPLCVAAEQGHRKVIQLLLELSSDINGQSKSWGSSALYAALIIGHKEIAMLLLDKGASVNAHGELYGNPLQAASFYGYNNIVTLLLDKGANVNAQGGYYGNTLQAASAKGYKDIVTLLLDKGADVNAQGGQYGNALQAASASGYKDVITLLLDKGADVNAQGGLYGNALQAASARGYDEIATLLQEHGASRSSL